MVQLPPLQADEERKIRIKTRLSCLALIARNGGSQTPDLWLKGSRNIHRDHNELYEVTQLINSMYCILVVPEEVFGVKKSGKKLTEFSTKEKRLKKYSSYHELVKIIDEIKGQNRLKYGETNSYNEKSPVCCVLYNMRNALFHDNIGFLPITSDRG